MKKIRLQGTLYFILSPTLTLIDVLSDNRIVESQVFLSLFFYNSAGVKFNCYFILYRVFLSQFFRVYILMFCDFIILWIYFPFLFSVLGLHSQSGGSCFSSIVSISPLFFFSNSIFLLFFFSYFGHVLESLSHPLCF